MNPEFESLFQLPVRIMVCFNWSKSLKNVWGKIKVDDPESQLRNSRNIQNSSAHKLDDNLGRVNRSQVKLMRVGQVITVEWGERTKTGSVKQDTTQ